MVNFRNWQSRETECLLDQVPRDRVPSEIECQYDHVYNVHQVPRTFNFYIFYPQNFLFLAHSLPFTQEETVCMTSGILFE